MEADAPTQTTPLALRLKTLRTDRFYSLQDLADRSGISRATLSRIENAEVSPTAETLGALATAFGMTISRILAPVERPFQALIPRDEQTAWHDPRGGFTRTIVSPPSGALSIEIIRCELVPRQTISYEKSPVAGLEHHLTLLSGALTVTIDNESYHLQPGDCLRYRLFGPTRFETGRASASYLLALAGNPT